MTEKDEIITALKELGIENGDVILVHSSLSSMQRKLSKIIIFLQLHVESSLLLLKSEI